MRERWWKTAASRGSETGDGMGVGGCQCAATLPALVLLELGLSRQVAELLNRYLTLQQSTHPPCLDGDSGRHRQERELQGCGVGKHRAQVACCLIVRAP